MTDSKPPNAPAFVKHTDLASRALGANVVSANDELFASRENLITATAPEFDPADFGHKGKIYDGWETRRRREAGHDWAIVRLGAPGAVQGIVVDTAWFRGNYPPFISIEAIRADDYPSVEQLQASDWATIVPKSPCVGDAQNFYPVDDRRVWTHVRLSIYPDGGVARLRVHGIATPDPAMIDGTIDLVAAENGGRLVRTSDAYYSSPAQLLLPGRARNMGDGWENARRRGGGNDFAIFALGIAGVIQRIEIDAAYFVGNAAGWARISVLDANTSDLENDDAWRDVLARRPLAPDTRHQFLAEHAIEATHVRLDVYPDGGLSRLRLWGAATGAAKEALSERWRSPA